MVTVDAKVVILLLILGVLLFGREAVLGAITGIGGIMLLLIIGVIALFIFFGGLVLLDKYIFTPIGKFLEPVNRVVQKWDKWYQGLGGFKQYGVLVLSITALFAFAMLFISLVAWYQTSPFR